MAMYIASVTIGDYRYYLYADGHASARVTDMTKESYGALQEIVTYEGESYTLTDLYDKGSAYEGCFSGCTSLTTAPSIPSSVTNMGFCFDGCSSLTSAPTIPSSVTDMSGCFRGCTSLTTAPSIPSSVTNMYACFRYCTSLTAAPSIPSGVVSLSQTFMNCTSLVEAPEIPDGVSVMGECFRGCTSLTTAPSIPSSVTSMPRCFNNCYALTGDIGVSGAPARYDYCFYGTSLPITLLVADKNSLQTWQQVAATGNNENVRAIIDPSVIPAPTATITAVRVASAGSTTPDETGQYAYITVRTTASTEQAPDNVAQAPTITLDGTAYTPADPSGTATFTCHVALGDEAKHVIGATPRDLYKTGTEVTVTLASTYSPMEFYQGGNGAALGKHATKQGVLDIGWDVETDGAITADGAVSGASVGATGDVTAGGKVTATGEVKGSDCKSANYSLEDVGDSISQVVTRSATRHPTNTRGGSISYARCGGQVMVKFSLDVTATANNSVIATGLPRPSEDWFVVACAGGNQVMPMYVSQSTGELRLNSAHDARWWVGSVTYPAAS